MALFPHDSFVVVDIPARLALHVRGLRRDYGSARQFLPAEITLAGSSGVGVFAAEQDADEALRALGRIAGASQPFDFELGAVERFPDSGLFYYAIKDPAPLVALHQRLVTSGLRFKPSSFAFSPHLTIDTFEDATPQLEAELRALPVPAGLHRAASISVYSLHGWDCRLVQTYELGATERGSGTPGIG